MFVFLDCLDSSSFVFVVFVWKLVPVGFLLYSLWTRLDSLDSFGLVWTLDSFGLVWTRLNSFELVWTRLDSFGLVWTLAN